MIGPSKILVFAAVWVGGLSALIAGDAPPAPAANVVLVHGIWNTGAMFDPLIERLKKQGCRCFAPSLQPNDCRHGVRELTLELSTDIDAEFGKTEPLFLVGFSLGGLVSRDYVQNLGHGRRVRAFFMISTASRGTLWADLSPRRGVRQLAPGSAFLDTLNADTTAWQNIPVYAYWTPFDLMVLPATNSRCAFGDTRCILCPFHPWMVHNPEVMADITQRIGLLAK